MVNIDDLPPSAFTSAFNASGAVGHVYTPPNDTLALNQWPTLYEMTNDMTNLVVFMDTMADFSSVPYLIDEFSHMFEDAYGACRPRRDMIQADVRTDVTSPTWDCAANRSTGNPGSSMMLINHFLDSVSIHFNYATELTGLPAQTYTIAGSQLFVPDKASITTTNSESSLNQHIGNCQNIWG